MRDHGGMKLTSLPTLVVLLGACSAPSPLAGVLESSGPAPDRPAEARLYDFLVGRWDLKVIGYGEDGARQESRGELAADFVLEGRAIQDVWITPPRGERGAGAPDLPVTGAFYGTTLRIYDPGLDAWRIQWNDPTTQFYAQQIGRPVDDEIVQLGDAPGGGTLRWRFTEIRADSFHWIGDVSADDGATWTLVVEIFARRRG
jgi:hypothetical protein